MLCIMFCKSHIENALRKEVNARKYEDMKHSFVLMNNGKNDIYLDPLQLSENGSHETASFTFSFSFVFINIAKNN